MADSALEDPPITTAAALLDALKAEIGNAGFQHLLDPQHSVTFVARGPKLIVTFEQVQDTLSSSDQGLPLGLDFADDKNWSVLHFTADGDTWFRSAALYEFLDELADDCFFDDFDQVLFYGAKMGGYAAAAFSVVSPGARVVAIAPQATLDPARSEWENRFPIAKRLTFTDRYGYAPEMVEGAAEAFVLYDPHELMDAVHASLFQGPNVRRLKCRFLRSNIASALRSLDLLHRILEEAAEGRLSEQVFYAHLRKRRDHRPFLRTLLYHLDDQQRPYLTALFCSHVLNRMNAPAFRKRLNTARIMLGERGALPAWLSET